MGHKKRSPLSRSKQLSPVEETGKAQSCCQEVAVGNSVGNRSVADEHDSHEYAAIKLECERALIPYRRGNHTKAFRLMKDIFSRHGGEKRLSSQAAALILRIQATVCAKISCVMDDANAKHRYMKLALESARRATELSPNSVEFAYSYANLLYDVAIEGKQYDEVTRECDRALEIEFPVDPCKEKCGEKMSGTPDSRIEQVRSDLRNLKQKASISSISTWMKSLGTGEEIKLIPIRRFPDDPMDLRLMQATKRPNEIKNAYKTPEERRKEIEVRVAAARLMQQQQQQQKPEAGSDRSDKLVGEASLVERRGGGSDRRKFNRRNDSNAERRDKLRAFWKSMSSDMKKSLLKVKIMDLKCHVRSSKDGVIALEVLNEALGFAEENKNWRFWSCCKCFGKFADWEIYMHHIKQEHLGNLSPKMQAAIPSVPANNWIDMILNCSWKPEDVPPIVDFSTHQNDECEDCSKETRDAVFNEDVELDESDNVVPNVHVAEVAACNYYRETGDENLERAQLLERIHGLFGDLIGHNCLATSHLTKVIQFTMDELRTAASGYSLKDSLDQSPKCICFLGVNSLRKIVKFLHELSTSCSLQRHSDKISVHCDASAGSVYEEIKDSIIMSDDSSWLHLDEVSLQCHEATSTSPDSADGFLSWIFEGPSTGDQLQSWICKKEEKVRKGLEMFQALEKEFHNLQNLYLRKCEHLDHEEALQTIEDLCLEGRKKDSAIQPGLASYDTILKARRSELETDSLSPKEKIELEVISSILKDAFSINNSKELYNGVASQFCDLESGENDSFQVKDYNQQMDSRIEVAIQRQKEQASMELGKVDARMMHISSEMQQLELRLDPIIANDYRLIVLPLVKSYMRAQLEELAEKDATARSDAAREAFLAELALDLNKGSRGGYDTRNSQERSKVKKKNKDLKKIKDSKVINLNDYHSLGNDTGKHLSSHSEPDEIHAQLGEISSNLQQEVELRRQIELEDEEKLLQETLEYQRKVENGAKSRHLASQIQKNDIEGSEELDINLDLGADDVSEPQKPDLGSDQMINELPRDEQLEISNSFISMDSSSEQTEAAEGSRKDLFRGKGDLEEISSGSYDAKIQLVEPHVVQTDVMLTVDDNGTRTLSEFKGKDEERFQADLKMAVNESLVPGHEDTFQPYRKMRHNSTSRRSALETHDACKSGNGVSEVPESSLYGAGLKNDIGEYNCFLNVIIQSLWHIRQFRHEFLTRSVPEHSHVGDPCVVCSLYDIFVALDIASNEMKREAVAPTSLRIALSNLYPNSNFFQEAQMNDASEVLVVIFECLHKSFTCGAHSSNPESKKTNCMGSWDCTNHACIVHSHFGMDIFERMKCLGCGMESRQLKYSSFFHNINANALRTMKVTYPETAFDELLHLVEISHQLVCDPEYSGCGKLNHIDHSLLKAPHVFTTVLGWQKTCESAEDIAATLAALSSEINLGVLYGGLPYCKHTLVSVVCYYGQHYHCFAYSHDHKRWFMYDDKTVKVVGGWADVLETCEKGRLQPQVLFFEASN